MKKKIIFWSSNALIALTPVLALAQQAGKSGGCSTVVDRGTVQYLICVVANIIDLIIPILILLAILYFVWGVISFMINADSEEAQTKGRDRIIYGVVGLAAIMAMWGLVGIVKRTFGIDQNRNQIDLPQTPF